MADPFAVWGKPPAYLTKNMTRAQLDALRRYVDSVSDKTYRIAFDNGVTHAFGLLISVAQARWKKELRAKR